MSLKERIIKDMITAMKNKDAVKRDVLRVLKGEIERAEQSSKGRVELTDAEVTKIVKKTYEGIKDTSYNEDEMAIIAEYMPRQMSEDEIRDVLTEMVDTLNIRGAGMKEMGRLMGVFNSSYNGMADGKTVASIAKTLLI